MKITLTGVVEDEHAAKATAAALQARLKDSARLAIVDTDTVVAAELSTHSLTKAFLEEMDKIEPAAEQGRDYRCWLLARQYGLEELAAKLREAK